MKALFHIGAMIALVTLAPTVSVQAADKEVEGKEAIKAAPEKPKPENKFAVGDGKVTFQAPAAWEKRQPKSRIIEHEFAIPAEEGDKQEGRMTVMGAGGSIEANIDRWYGQFDQADGSDTKDASGKPETLEIGDTKIVIVDIRGTYKDAPGGPFGGGKTVERPDYRMLAAIVSTEKDGNYFLKFYGPAKTVDAHEEGFNKMVKELEQK